jgi:hypothetical protein
MIATIFIIVLVALLLPIGAKGLSSCLTGSLFGFGVAGLLLMSGMMAIETGGYGSSAFLLIYSAPFGLLGTIGSVVGIFILWTLLWGLSGAVHNARTRNVMLGIIMLHFFTMPFILMTSESVWGMERLKVAFRSGGILLIGSIPLYLYCHAYLLIQIARKNKEKGAI